MDGMFAGLPQDKINELRAHYEQQIASGMSPDEAMDATGRFAVANGYAKGPRLAAPEPPVPIDRSLDARMSGAVPQPSIPPVGGIAGVNNLAQRMSGVVPMPTPAPRGQPGTPAPTLPAPQTVGPVPMVANNFPAAGPRVQNVSNTAPSGSLMSAFADPNKPFPGMSLNQFPQRPDGPEDRGGITPYAQRMMRHSPQLARALMQNRPGLY